MKEVPVEVIKEVVRTVEVIKEKIVRVIEYRDVIKEVPVEVCQQTPPLPTKVLWNMGGRRRPWAKWLRVVCIACDGERPLRSAVSRWCRLSGRWSRRWR